MDTFMLGDGLYDFLVPNILMHFTFLHSFAPNVLHIDTGNEELTQQLPLVEEPEDQEPTNPEQEEYP